jgi:hypothetical protein
LKFRTDESTNRLEVLLVFRPVLNEKLDIALGKAGGDIVAWLVDKLLELSIICLGPLLGSCGRLGRHRRFMSLS